MYKRITEDIYITQGLYFGIWEDLTIDSTLKEARQMLRDYNENDPATPHRIIKKRVKIEN
ncbi:MAG: hypothetical protein MJ126_09055 [Lachnospiraceae bacterium]|nr:hypothetical protein [Lachnospiraceae bacterium]